VGGGLVACAGRQRSLGGMSGAGYGLTDSSRGNRAHVFDTYLEKLSLLTLFDNT
jgi:hypothetical protein